MQIEQDAVVVDAGPLIHLDELQSLDLLGDLSPLLAPELVRSIRRGLRSQSQILDTLSSIRKNSTLHISESLLSEIITRIHKSNA